MLSVLHVMSRMEPAGTELQLAGMLRASDGRWRPTLCVLYPGFALARALAEDGIDVIELGSRGPAHLDRLRQLRALVRAGGYDVMHTSLWGAGAFGRLSILGADRPAVVMSERRVEHFRSKRRRTVDRALRRVTDAWIGNSDDVAEFIVRAHRAQPERVHVIRNGVDSSVFHPGPARPRPAGGRKRVGALGRLTEQKGFDVLLRAIPRVLEQCDAEFVIVGEGELRTELESAAGALPVSFPGALAGPTTVADYLRGLDLFVMPSRYEGLPNAVLEALACGVPVVATDVPGMRAAAGDAARLIQADDPQALAEAIVAELASPSPANATWGRGFVEVADEHLRVFELAMSRRRSTPANTAGTGINVPGPR